MNKESMKLDELYPESDATTKRDLEGLANAIGQFRSAVHHIAAGEDASPIAWQLEQARARQRTRQRRVMLEWAVAAALCVAAMVPAVNLYRDHAAAVRAQQQAQLLKQRQADTALLDQVTSELSEAVPDSLQPLAELDSDYTNNQATMGGSRNGRN